MDLPWGDEKTLQFVTNVGLITSDGPNGPNIMAAEWTHHVSYSPGLIAVCVGFGKATLENIQETKEFGVSLASIEQNVVASIAGGASGHDIDKIAVLKELGFKFYPGKKIKTLMVEGAALNAECKLVKEITLGDHMMLVGEVIETASPQREPVAYHKGMYWRLERSVEKPSEKERERIRAVVEKHKK